jgi:hypothetical protein
MPFSLKDIAALPGGRLAWNAEEEGLIENSDLPFQPVQVTLGGAMGIRTPDLLNAIEALYQLSYDPKRCIASPTNRRSDGGVNLG